MIKRKLKPLLPTLKEKKRYIAFEILSEKRLKNMKLATKKLNNKIVQFLGIKEAANAGIQMIDEKNNIKQQKGMLRVAAAYVDDIKAALTVIGTLEGSKTIVHCLGVSGILNKCYEHHVR